MAKDTDTPGTRRIDALFTPFRLAGRTVPNRIVMAPMTRCMAPGGVPTEDVARYYRRRAEGGVGLVITEGAWIPHPSASNEPNAPRFYGEDALAGWRRVAEQVHEAGGLIIPQLWHVGQTTKTAFEGIYADAEVGVDRQVGPSGMVGGSGQPPELLDTPATQQEIDEVSQAYVDAAVSAYELGFDGVELHAAHGYIFDQFFWHETNLRTDRYGGDLVDRTRFASEIVREMRARTSPDFPILMRLSQWKIHDYTARLVTSPAELERFLAPLSDAGVDAFHCSQRRFWDTEFGTDMSFAGWVKKVSGKAVITVGSVTLEKDMLHTIVGKESETGRNLDWLLDRFERGEFDLVAIGRALITNPDWPQIVRTRGEAALQPYHPSVLANLD